VSGGVIQAGDMAPDFTLSSTSGSDVTLSSFRGRQNVLVAFFPAAFTGTCDAEVCEFGDELSQYASRNTAVLPISVDQLPTLRALKKHEGVKVDMLADVRRDVVAAYGVLDDRLYRANRAYFLVDKEGVVRWRHVEANNGEKRETAELLRQIEALG
jgi:peroxiredoxin